MQSINQSLYDVLLASLKQNPRYFSEDGELLRNSVIEDANKLEKNLISNLLADTKLKSTFFTDVEGILVFDKLKFIGLINNKQFLPDSFTRFKNKIGLVDSKENFISDSNDVQLVFPYKDCVLEGGQTKEDQKKPEIFYNKLLCSDQIDRLLSPKVFINSKKYTKENLNGKEVNSISESDNLIIKGNNLLVLSSLLKRYEGEIKLIYLDPPFNTGNDSFKYNDNFNHTSWLTFMKNRLEIAKKLLISSGVIAIECDDNEQAYLKILMDEIFGRDNFIASIVVRSNSISGNKTQHKEKTILKNKDIIHCYKKGSDVAINPQYVKKEKWDTHYNGIIKKTKDGSITAQRLLDCLIENNILKENDKITEDIWDKNKLFRSFVIKNKGIIYQPVNSISPELKQKSLESPDEIIEFKTPEDNILYALNGKRLSTLDKTIKTINGEDSLVQLLGDLWTDIDFQNTQNQGGVSFTNAKKPEQLIKRIIEMFTNKGDLILDFFAGSGTSATTALKLDRRFIIIEQMEYIKTITKERIKNVILGEKGGISKEVKWQGGGSFVYCELATLNQDFVDKVINAGSDPQLVDLYKEISHSDFISTKVDPRALDSNADDFSSLSTDNKRKLLLDLLDMNMLYKNYCDIDDEDFKISDSDKQFNKSFYGE